MAFYLQRALHQEVDETYRDTSGTSYSKNTITLHINRQPPAAALSPDGTVAITLEQASGIQERESGFLYELPKSSFNPRTAADPIDILVVALKSDMTIPVVTSLLPRMRRQGDPRGPSTVMFLQNGVGHAESFLAHFFPDGQAALTAASPLPDVQPIAQPYFLLNSNSHGTARKQPLHVCHMGKNTFHFSVPPEPRFGSAWEQTLFTHLSNKKHIAPSGTDTMSNLIQLLGSPVLAPPSDARCIIESFPEFEVRVLQKLVVNSCVNPIGALYEVLNGEIIDDPALHELALAIVSECATVLRTRWLATHGGDVPSGLAQGSLMAYVESLVRVNSKNTASMLQDILARRGSTEIDLINGTVSTWGRQYNVSTPVNDQIVLRVKEKTDRLRNERELEEKSAVAAKAGLA